MNFCITKFEAQHTRESSRVAWLGRLCATPGFRRPALAAIAAIDANDRAKLAAALHKIRASRKADTVLTIDGKAYPVAGLARVALVWLDTSAQLQ